MQIVRAPRPERHFTTYENSLIRDSRVTLRARGLLMLLLSFPDDWRTDYRTLARQEPEGEHAIRSALKELREAGYIVQKKIRGDRGRFVTTTLVYDTPQLPDQTCGDSPRLVDRSPDGPVPEGRRSYEEPTTKDLYEVGQPDADVGQGPDSDASPLRGERVDEPTRLPRKRGKRKPLTKKAHAASWTRFLTMDLEDLPTDRDTRGAAFLQLIQEEGIYEPDNWAADMINRGEWAGFCERVSLGADTSEVVFA